MDGLLTSATQVQTDADPAVVSGADVFRAGLDAMLSPAGLAKVEAAEAEFADELLRGDGDA